MDKKIKFEIDEVKLIEEISDSQLAIVEIYVCHDGNNCHDLPISLESLKQASSTLLNKFLVAAYNGFDFEGHEDYEQIVGFFPKENDIRYIKKDNGKTYLVANAILSKVYAPWAYEIFANSNEDNYRAVSMEIGVFETEIKDDGLEWIKTFIFNGVTLLGKNVDPACPGSNAKIVKFSNDKIKEAEKIYHDFTSKQNSESNTQSSKKEEITNFPIKGDNKEISLSNSKYPQFDYEYAKK